MNAEPSTPRLYIPELEPGEEWLDVTLHFHSSAPEKADHTKPGAPIADKFELGLDRALGLLCCKADRRSV